MSKDPAAEPKGFKLPNLLSDYATFSAGGGTGGAGRNRTDDILLAKQALSQLSYGPIPS